MKTNHVRALNFAWVLAAGAACSSQAAAAQEDYFGSLSAAGVYADGSKLLDDEEDSNRSALIARGQGGVRWMHGDSATSLTASSNYYQYTDSDRRDRWNNEVELVHERSLSKTVDLSLSASAGSNYSTLEYRSADQLALSAEVFYRPSRQHRFGIGAGYRHRQYDDSAGTSGTAPYAQASYRYRPNNRHRFDVETRFEWVDAEKASYEYARQRLDGFYTRTFNRENRLRVGVVAQNWEHDSRQVSGGSDRLHRWRIQPQIRYTRTLRHDATVEIDYQRDLRRSNDPSREEDGNRLSLTLRKRF